MSARSSMTLWMAASLLAWTGSAAAQDATPDRLVLQDGTLIQGALVEAPASGAISFRTAAGQVRSFPREQVRTLEVPTGTVVLPRTAPRPPPPPAAAPTADPTVRVQLMEEDAPGRRRTDPRPLTLHNERGVVIQVVCTQRGCYLVRDPVYGALGTAPQTLQMPIGAQAFAVSLADRRPVAASDDYMDVTGPGTLAMRYEDRWPLRLAGIVTLAVGVPLGLVIGLAALGTPGAFGTSLSSQGVGLVGAGVGIGGAALAVGVPLVFQFDRAGVRFAPLGTGDH